MSIDRVIMEAKINPSSVIDEEALFKKLHENVEKLKLKKAQIAEEITKVDNHAENTLDKEFYPDFRHEINPASIETCKAALFVIDCLKAKNKKSYIESRLEKQAKEKGFDVKEVIKLVANYSKEGEIAYPDEVIDEHTQFNYLVNLSKSIIDKCNLLGIKKPSGEDINTRLQDLSNNPTKANFKALKFLLESKNEALNELIEHKDLQFNEIRN